MKQRQKGFLDPYIIDSLVDRDFSARWSEIKEDLLLKVDVDDKTFSVALKRLIKLGLIKQENDIYWLVLELPRPGEPFEIIKGYWYLQSLKILAEEICLQENTEERTKMLANYLFRTWQNITSLYLYMLEKYIGTRYQKIPEKDAEIRARRRAEEYLDREMMVLAALMKRTARLFNPPKKPRFTVLAKKPPKRIKISQREINIAGRIITKTLASGLQEDNMVMVRKNSGVLDWQEDFGLSKGMFNWDNIPGNDNGKLIEVLKEDFGIDWVEKAKIEKIDDGNTIRVSTEKNSLSLRLNDEKTKVNLEIDDSISYEFILLKEKGKLNIYYQDYPPGCG